MTELLGAGAGLAGPDRVRRTDEAAGDGLSEVTFVVDARDGVDHVSLVGDFNGWSPQANPMHRRGDRFTTCVRLAARQRHRYQFVVDGARWENDWRADDYEENALGAFVSVVDLTTPLRSGSFPLGGSS